MVWANIGAIGLGTGDVRDVDRVLGVYGAAQVATPQVLAALLRHAAERVVARLAEVNGDRQQFRLATGRLADRGKRADLVESRLRGRGSRLEGVLRERVPGVEVVPRDRGRPAILEHVVRGSQLD